MGYGLDGRGRWLRAGMAAALVAAGLALPRAVQAQTLRMGVGAQVTSIDPEYHNISPNNAFASMVFDALVATDGQSRLKPGLALSWKPIADDVWEFKLRPNVTFQNGRPFTADDVAFTFQRIPTIVNSPGSFSTYIYSIASVEIVDPLTLRLHTKGPDPLLPADLSLVYILSRATDTGMTTEDFNSGKAAIGTGPYRVNSVRFGDRVELDRNDSYWGGKPTWEHVSYRQITNEASRAAALLSGDVDFIDQVPTSDVARMAADRNVRLSQADSLRLVYIALDHMRTGSSPFITDNDGKPLDKNPLKDLRVRQALSLAIDRNAEVARVMEGVATPTMQYMAKGTYGYVPDLQPPHPDQEQARKLLAAAGYPQGFHITLHGPNDRYPNDFRIVQAVAQMWTRIGVRTAVDTAPYASFITRASKQEFSAFLVSWGTSTGEPSAGLRSTAATYDAATGMGSVNRGRYSNPAFDKELLTAMRTLDDDKREAMLQDATRLLIDDVGVIPIHLQKNVWAMRVGLLHDARVDELTRPQDVHIDPAVLNH
jgi:peptide/nickel transport system substrate-binding protein